MEALVHERDVIETPQINSWRQVQPPSREQIRYATDLCRSELPYAERVRTIQTFDTLDGQAISALIDSLAELRRQRMLRLRKARRRAPRR